nr:g-type lectin s-receptor-like serine/threonine-protein kinase [Quercus suber]
MGLLSKTILLSVLFFFCLNLGFAIDIIRSSQSLKDPDYIISNGSTFRLGFFNPVNSTNRYLGIWYNNISVFTVIWVANRQKPLKDSSGVLTISEDGNLAVLNRQEEILWLSNVSNYLTNSSAMLLDSGNLLLQVDTKGIIWVSFQHPSDSFLPDGHPFWRTGPWNGQAFIGVYNTNPQYHNGYTVEDDKEGTTFATFAYVNELPLSKFVLNSQGKLVQSYWNNRKEDWEVLGIAPKFDSEVYGTCGAFRTCHSLGSSMCSCLRGFEPKIIDEWNRGNWTSGCVRRAPLQCDRVNNSGEEGKEDWFFMLKTMKVPDFAERSYVAKDDC